MLLLKHLFLISNDNDKQNNKRALVKYFVKVFASEQGERIVEVNSLFRDNRRRTRPR